MPYPAVELGIGAFPWTVQEWFARLDGPCEAVDHDPPRVQRAVEAGLHARVGSFDLGAPAGLIRAVNVLREVGWDARAVRQLNDWLLPGGLLVEATTDKPGRVFAARLWGPQLEDRGWLFGWDGERGFHPRMFRGQVPRAERGVLERWAEAEPVELHDGFAAWLPPTASPRSAP